MVVHIVLILLHLLHLKEVKSSFLTHLRMSNLVVKWLRKHPPKLVNLKTAGRIVNCNISHN